MKKQSNELRYAGTLRCAVVSVLFVSGFSTVSLLSANDAEAQSRICRQLGASLASLDANTNRARGSKQYREYDSAVREQQKQITKTRRIAKKSGCLRRGIFKNRSAQCKRIVDSLRRMEANVGDLKRTRARYAPKQVGNSRKRRIILRDMERNRCDSGNARTASAEAPRKSRRRTLLEQIFGVRTYRENGNRSNEEVGDEYSNFGTFRTLCVRKTDGYYFPISFSTTPVRFDIDEAACQAMCPGTEVALYHHRMPSQDSEEMVELGTRKPYASEPFAFAYRKEHNPENRCRFSTASATEEASASLDLGGDQTPINQPRVAIPTKSQDRTLSPDAFDNQQYGLSLTKATEILKAARAPKAPNTGLVATADRKIRVVGPAFYPVQ